MTIVRWLHAYSTARLPAAVEWERSATREVAAECLAQGRSVLLRDLKHVRLGLVMAGTLAWASTRDAYSFHGDDGRLRVNPERGRCVALRDWPRVWSETVRDCRRTGRRLYHSEVGLRADRRITGIAYRAGDETAESQARTVGAWLRVPIVSIEAWKDRQS